MMVALLGDFRVLARSSMLSGNKGRVSKFDPNSSQVYLRCLHTIKLFMVTVSLMGQPRKEKVLHSDDNDSPSDENFIHHL